MPKYYCDYCDTYLTHDSPSVRKTHCIGRKHRDNVKFYYQKWMEEQAQHLIDATTAAFKAGKIAQNPFSAPPPNMNMTAVPPPGAGFGPPGRMLPPPGIYIITINHLFIQLNSFVRFKCKIETHQLIRFIFRMLCMKVCRQWCPVWCRLECVQDKCQDKCQVKCQVRCLVKCPDKDLLEHRCECHRTQCDRRWWRVHHLNWAKVRLTTKFDGYSPNDFPSFKLTTDSTTFGSLFTDWIGFIF